MKVVALLGMSNCGKTETLNYVYQLLLANGYVQVPGHYQDLSNRDCLDVFQKGKDLFGFVNQGDYAITKSSLKNHLQYLQKAGCIKTICACTSKPGTIKAVTSYPIHHFINKIVQPIDSLRRIDDYTFASLVYSVMLTI